MHLTNWSRTRFLSFSLGWILLHAVCGCKDDPARGGKPPGYARPDGGTRRTAGAAESTPPKAQRSRGEIFLDALEKNDVRALIDSSAEHQAELRSIRQSNPKELWPGLTSEYYAKKTEVVWSPYPIQFGTPGWITPRSGVELLRTLMVPGYQRRLTGSKKGWADSRARVLGAEADVLRETIEFSYASPERAPFGAAASSEPRGRPVTGQRWYPLKRTRVDVIMSLDGLYVGCEWAGFGASSVFADAATRSTP